MIDTGAGVIDADYRGEVKVLLFNLSQTEFQGAFTRSLACLKRVSRARSTRAVLKVPGAKLDLRLPSHSFRHSPRLSTPFRIMLPFCPARPPDRSLCTVKQGDRVAQLILERIVTPEVEEVDSLAETVRGAGGFGSTGGFGVAPAPAVEESEAPKE